MSKEPFLHVLSPIAKITQRLTGDVLGKRQPDVAGLIRVWPNIVGELWASRISPLGYKRNHYGQVRETILEVGGDAGTGLLVHHESPILIEKINAFLGEGRVNKIRFVALETPQRKTRLLPPAPPPLVIEGIEDERLAAALGRLGAYIKAKANRAA